MKVNFVFLISCCLIVGCTGKRNEKANQANTDTTATAAKFKLVKTDARKIGPAKSSEQIQIDEALRKIEINKNIPVVGYWVGMFGKNKINIAIAEISGDKALGYTVCAGNFRPVSGMVTVTGDSLYTFDLKEPGSEPYDGHFEFEINTHEEKLHGTWSPFKDGITDSKQFELSKTPFQYNTLVGEYPEASQRMLTQEDVANRLAEELSIMRNGIYARHGYSFKAKAIRQHFDTATWYMPMNIDVRDNLTDIEVQNIDLIYQYEEYYKEAYNDYGR